MSCSALRGRAAGSPPNTSQVSLQVVGRYLGCLAGFARVACLHSLFDPDPLAHSVNHCACCSPTRGSQDAFQAAQWYYPSTWVTLVSGKPKVSRRHHCRSDPVRVQSTESGRAFGQQVAQFQWSGRVFAQCGRSGSGVHVGVCVCVTFAVVTPEGVLRPAGRKARAMRAGT